MTTHAVALSDADHEMLRNLRHRRRERHREPKARAPSLGERTADRVAETVGSWPFILAQSGVILAWIAVNVVAWYSAWDPYPFILLNLVLSFQAAYTAPMILMSQNRAAAMDRKRAEDDYHVNLKAELEIELLHQKIDLMREQEIVKLTEALQRLQRGLEKRA